ncbi:MAG TPA: thymidine kinase [Chloroflexi bacterium]|nr:MAG: thymidine kinase [Chloroflexota bacterium]HDD55246.1 thymidine kinase [Chloroflexota bacterium]
MKHHRGRLEVITGPMFCGKTDELLRRLRRASIAKQNIQVFKPGFDIRYGNEKVTSHAGNEYEAYPVENITEIPALLQDDVTVVAIDEAQFFEDEIIPVVQDLVDRGIRVIVAGLDMDFRGVPFGQMPQLLAQAEIVDKLQAICMVCGEEATRTQRLVDGEPAYYDDPIIIVGASEMYEARCRIHHQVPKKD